MVQRILWNSVSFSIVDALALIFIICLLWMVSMRCAGPVLLNPGYGAYFSPSGDLYVLFPNIPVFHDSGLCLSVDLFSPIVLAFQEAQSRNFLLCEK